MMGMGLALPIGAGWRMVAHFTQGGPPSFGVRADLGFTGSGSGGPERQRGC